MEEIKLKDINGVWTHQEGASISVFEDGRVEFDNGMKFTIEEKGDTLVMDGWTVRLSKSSIEELVWKKKGQEDTKWSFEEDHMLSLEDAQIDTTNIISGKRRRKMATDYVSLNKQMDKEEEMASKRALLAQQNSALEMIAARQKKRRRIIEEEYDASQSSAPAADAKAKPEVKREPLSAETLREFKAKLDAADAKSTAASDLLPMLSKLETAQMDVKTLTSTLIAKSLNPFRKHPDPAVASKSKTIFRGWKALYKAAVKK